MTIREAFKELQERVKQDSSIKMKDVFDTLGISKGHFYNILNGRRTTSNEATKRYITLVLKEKYNLIIDDESE